MKWHMISISWTSTLFSTLGLPGFLGNYVLKIKDFKEILNFMGKKEYMVDL